MKQGDIVIVPFPFSDLKQSKYRPAVIVSTSVVNKTHDVILAQITSQNYTDEFSFIIEQKHLSSPLEKISQVRCHKIVTLDKSLILKKVSAFHPENKKQLLNKIKIFFDFELMWRVHPSFLHVHLSVVLQR